MARRNGVTLIVTLLHCPALTEIDSGKSLLNWGFAVDGKVRPVGTLVSARLPPAAAPRLAAAPAPPARGPAAARPAPGGQPARRRSTAAGFSGAALLVARPRLRLTAPRPSAAAEPGLVYRRRPAPG